MARLVRVELLDYPMSSESRRIASPKTVAIIGQEGPEVWMVIRNPFPRWYRVFCISVRASPNKRTISGVLDM
jgi:hypothetical protein